MKAKVTVVVPSYNTARVIGKCLDSILNQTLKDTEIIVVDDGSTDKTVQVAKQYAQKDSRISIIEQPHSNAGDARNRGIDKAQGEYVVFWDSDDFFEAEALEKLYNKSTEKNLDICICNAWHWNEYLQIDEEGGKVDEEFIPEKEVFSYKDAPQSFYNVTANVPWNKMFRLAFLREKDIRFQSITKANDVYFNLIAMAQAERISIINENLVHWRYNQSGTTTTTDVSRSPMCVFEAFEKAKEKLVELGIYEEVKISFLNKAVGSYLYVLECQRGLGNLQNFRNMFDYIRDEAFKKLDVDEIREQDILKKKKYDRLQMVINGSYEEYLLWREQRSNESLNRWKKNYRRMETSYAYRTGMKVTWLPRKINGMLKGGRKEHE